jgi:hypothetical protein
MPSRGLKKREKRPNENHYVIESGQAMDGKDLHMLERMDVCMHVINNLPLSIWSKKCGVFLHTTNLGLGNYS